jgi:hypothetical protein
MKTDILIGLRATFLFFAIWFSTIVIARTYNKTDTDLVIQLIAFTSIVGFVISMGWLK